MYVLVKVDKLLISVLLYTVVYWEERCVSKLSGAEGHLYRDYAGWSYPF